MQTEAFLVEKVYRLPRFVNIYLLLFPLIGIVWIGFGLLTFLPSLNDGFLDSGGTTSVGIVVFVLMMSMYKAIKATRLVLTDDGIIHYAWGFRIYTPWQNVVGITRRKLYSNFPQNFRKFHILELRQPSVLGMKLVEGKQRGIAALETDWWNPAWSMKLFAGVVPLSPMLHGRNWKESALTRDIQEHAPWIVIDEGM
jgi:hypothetical protein